MKTQEESKGSQAEAGHAGAASIESRQDRTRDRKILAGYDPRVDVITIVISKHCETCAHYAMTAVGHRQPTNRCIRFDFPVQVKGACKFHEEKETK